MQGRESIYLSWKKLTNKYQALLQELKSDTAIGPEQRLNLELLVERQIISGLSEITKNLSYHNSRKVEAKNV